MPVPPGSQILRRWEISGGALGREAELVRDERRRGGMDTVLAAATCGSLDATT